MSTSEEEIALLEKKIALLKQLKEIENKTSSSTPSLEDPKRTKDEEIKRKLQSLTPGEALLVLLKRKDIKGPFRDQDDT